jgi:hypothetical protein
VRREWSSEDLVASWTLIGEDWLRLVANKSGATRLGFAPILKFFEIEGRAGFSGLRMSFLLRLWFMWASCRPS